MNQKIKAPQPAHTPWRVVPLLSGSENHRGYHIVNAEGWRLALVQPGDEDGKLGAQHANLFAAAPELLEALDEMLTDIGRANSMPSAVKARAVLKKIKGEAA